MSEETLNYTRAIFPIKVNGAIEICTLNDIWHDVREFEEHVSDVLIDYKEKVTDITKVFLTSHLRTDDTLILAVTDFLTAIMNRLILILKLYEYVDLPILEYNSTTFELAKVMALNELLENDGMISSRGARDLLLICGILLAKGVSLLKSVYAHISQINVKRYNKFQCDVLIDLNSIKRCKFESGFVETIHSECLNSTFVLQNNLIVRKSGLEFGAHKGS